MSVFNEIKIIYHLYSRNVTFLMVKWHKVERTVTLSDVLVLVLFAGEEDRRFHTLKPARCFLPHAVVYLTWVVCVLMVAGCAAIAIIFGIAYGRFKINLRAVFFRNVVCFSTFLSSLFAKGT